MGMYSYETYTSIRSKEKTNDVKGSVGYFKLDDDGDEAIVRFDYDTPTELVLAHVHDEQVGNSKHRRVLCLRDGARDDMAKCPLCARGDKYFAKVYLKLIEYTKDENGKILTQAKIWERPEKFADDIVEYINNYGGLKDVVFKIKRKGAKGDTDTKYILSPMPSTVYTEAAGYVKDFSAFKDFSLFPHSFLSKSKEDMEEFVKTGNFPFRRKDGTLVTKEESTKVEEKHIEQDTVGGVHVGTYNPNVTAKDNLVTTPEFAQSEPIQAPGQVVGPEPTLTSPTTNIQSGDTNNPLMDRPRRRYDKIYE